MPTEAGVVDVEGGGIVAVVEGTGRGEICEAGASELGTSNGGVMRVAPAGLVHPGILKAAVELAFEVTYPTHGTHVTISAATAHTAGIAMELTAEADIASIVDAAREGARLGEEIGRGGCASSFFT